MAERRSCIGFIGTGQMGTPMASNLVSKGFDVRVWNRTASRLGPILVARRASSPRDAVKPGGIAVSMVSDDVALEAVTLGPDGILAGVGPGGVHVSMSTVSPRVLRTLAAAHERQGSQLVAAPVFGRPDAALSRRLWICASGPEAARERVRPVLEVLGQTVFEFGDDPGAAAVVKLAGNFLIASMMEALAEAFALAEKSGVERRALFDVLARTLFDCPLFANYGKLIAESAFEPARFRLPLGLKDIELALQAASSARMPMPLASLLRDRFYAALAKGRDDLDWAAIALGAYEDAGLA